MRTDLVPELVAARRSIRSFAPDPVDPELLDACVVAACLAPAPHHGRPWRFVVLAREGLAVTANAMAEAWRADLAADGVPAAEAAGRLDRSRERIGGAPAGILACLTPAGLDRYPDEPRRAAEATLADLSLGAALENLTLTATDLGLATCWIAAPAFCPDVVAAALDLPADVRPRALVLCGHPDPAYAPPLRPEVDLGTLRLRR